MLNLLFQALGLRDSLLSIPIVEGERGVIEGSSEAVPRRLNIDVLLLAGDRTASRATTPVLK